MAGIGMRCQFFPNIRDFIPMAQTRVESERAIFGHCRGEFDRAEGDRGSIAEYFITKN
jgi:hypothetical protein